MEDITKKDPKQDFKFNDRLYSSSDDVAFFSQELYILKLENNLIGDYDSTGTYSLPNEILKDLTSLKKTITKKEDEETFLKAECENREFKFVVKLSTPTRTQKVAQLFLIESFSVSISDPKQILSLVSSYIDDNDAFFDEKYKKIFNIVPDSEDGKKEENEIIAKALLEKLKFEKRVFTNFLLQSRTKDKIYVEKLLNSLSKDQTGAGVLKKYEALLAKHGKLLNPADKSYYRKLKQMLDEVLEEERKTLSNNLVLFLSGIRQAYVKSNYTIVETLKKAVIEKKKEIEKKVKLGKGFGPLKFSNYKGVNVKKNSKKEEKKEHPNLDSINNTIVSDSTVSDEASDYIKEAISIFNENSYRELISERARTLNEGKAENAKANVEEKVGIQIGEIPKKRPAQKEKTSSSASVNESMKQKQETVKVKEESQSIFGSFFEM